MQDTRPLIEPRATFGNDSPGLHRATPDTHAGASGSYADGPYKSLVPKSPDHATVRTQVTALSCGRRRIAIWCAQRAGQAPFARHVRAAEAVTAPGRRVP